MSKRELSTPPARPVKWICWRAGWGALYVTAKTAYNAGQEASIYFGCHWSDLDIKQESYNE